MTESTPWFKPMLNAMVEKMIRIGAISGAAIDANPVWGIPDKLLISKVWDASSKSNFIWTITGEDAITDYIQGSLAVTAQEAALHFSYKWQMDADQLLEKAKSKPSIANSDAVIEAHTKKMIGYAESLYDLASQDDVWK